MIISDEDHKAILNEVVSLRIRPKPNPDDPSKFDIHLNLGFKLQEQMGLDEGWDTIFDVALKRAQVAVLTGDGSCLAIDDEEEIGGTKVSTITHKRGASHQNKKESLAKLGANLMNSVIGRNTSEQDTNSFDIEETCTPHRVQFWQDGEDMTWIITPVEDPFLDGNVLSDDSGKLVTVINPKLGKHHTIRTNHNAPPSLQILIKCKESDWFFDNFRHVKPDGSLVHIKKKFNAKSEATARTLLRRLLTARGLKVTERGVSSHNVIAERESMVE